jgi:RNA polymerase sigma-70 factor (ECF subfamily)
MIPPSKEDSSQNSTDEAYKLLVQLLTASHGRLLGYLITLLGNRHDAEDVLQMASVTMWKRFETFTPGTNFVAWATKVAFYESREFRRMKVRSKILFDDKLVELLASERAEDLTASDDRVAALDLCLGQLDETSQRLIQAAYYEEGSLVELASKLGRAPQTLYNRLNGLKRLLAECVERRLAGVEP